jgi:hypothetical protein
MKFPTALLFLLPAAASGSTSLRGASPPALRSSQLFSLGVNASFVLNSGDDLTTDEQNFAKYSIRKSYNSVHNPHAIVMQFADIVDVSSQPTAGALTSVSAPKKKLNQPFGWAMGISTIGDCSLCGPQLADSKGAAAIVEQLTFDQLAWELALCSELSNGPYNTFQAITNCSIVVYMPDTGSSSAVQDVQMGVTSNFTLPFDRDLSTNEQFFAGECLRLSYNQVHDPANVFMATTDLTSQTYQIVVSTVADELDVGKHKKKAFSWSLQWATEASFNQVDASDDDNSSSALGNLPSLKVLAQQHNRWQVTFCQMLVSGPFEIFQSTQNCAISVSDATPVSTVAKTIALKT